MTDSLRGHLSETPGVVHIAGPDVTIGSRLRQRCAWCGEVLWDHDLDRIAVPVDQLDDDGGFCPPLMLPGALVLVDGNMKAVVPHEDGAQLPDNACDRLPPANAMADLIAAAFPEMHRAGLEFVNVQAAVEDPVDFHSPIRRFRIIGDLIREP